jgi:hypothetical protein
VTLIHIADLHSSEPAVVHLFNTTFWSGRLAENRLLRTPMSELGFQAIRRQTHYERDEPANSENENVGKGR